MNTIIALIAISLSFTIGITISNLVVYAQNTTTPTHSEVFAGINTDFIMALASLISVIAVAAGAFAKIFHVEGKVGTVITMAADGAKATQDNRILIKEGLQATYEMLPEQSQKLVDRPTIKEVELTKRINEYAPKVQKMGDIADKWGKVIDNKLKPPNEGG